MVALWYDFWDSVSHYSTRLFYGFEVKAAIAMLLTFFTQILYGDVFVFAIYFVLVAIDLVLGVLRSKLDGTYQFKYVLHWVRKVFTYLLIILVLGLVCQSLSRTTGLTLSAVNWLLFCCSITELTSIISNLRRLGCPVPKVVDSIMVLMHSHTIKHFEKFCGVPPTQSVQAPQPPKLKEISSDPALNDSPPREEDKPDAS